MKKFLMIFGGIVLGAVVIFAGLLVFTSLTSKKLVCKSSVGSITIMYSDKTLTGYTAVTYTYEFDEQKALAEEMGTEEYMNEFKTWFETNSDGTCEKK